MRTTILALILLTIFSCKEDEMQPPEMVNTITLIEPAGDFIYPYSRNITWTQLEVERSTIGVFKEESLTNDSRIYGDLVGLNEETTINFPGTIAPEQEYWIEISNSSTSLVRKVTIKSGVEAFVGDHNVTISQLGAGANEDSYDGVLNISIIDDQTIRLQESITGLDYELTFLDPNDNSLSIWYNRTAPDINIQIRTTDDYIRVKNYLEELNVGPYWQYVKQ